MTDEKLKIVKFERPVNSRPDITEAIEGLLVMAKEGKITGFYAAVQLVEDEIATYYSSSDEVFLAVGIIEHLKRRVLDSVDS